MIYDPFIEGYALSASTDFQSDITQNLYMETAVSAAAKGPKALVGSSGSRFFYDLGDGPIRGQLSIEGFDFVVSGGNVWVKDPSEVWTLLGTVANDGRPVKMVANNQKIFLRSAGFGYQVSGMVTPVPTPPWTSLADIEFLHGYYIGLDDDGSPTGGQFFISALNDPLTWDPLDFSTVPSSADKLRALAVSHDLLYVIGSIITQPFYDSGNADFPIVPNQSGAMEVGTIARDSVCRLAVSPNSDDNVIFFMSETPNGDGQLIQLVGFNPSVVSTTPIETRWAQASAADRTRIVTWCFQENGHTFVQVNFPQDSDNPLGAWRYDSKTGKWATATWTNPGTGIQEAHRGINHANVFGRHLIGDRVAGILWLMSSQIYSDSDPNDTAAVVPIVRSRTCQLPSQGTRTIFVTRVELLGETGVGDGTGLPDGDDPQIMLELSGDAGHTFDPNPEQITMGKQGEYDTRMVWTGCGSYRQPAIRISSSAPVKQWWNGLDIQIEEGVA